MKHWKVTCSQEKKFFEEKEENLRETRRQSELKLCEVGKQNQDPKTKYDISKNGEIDNQEVSLVSKLAKQAQDREVTEKPLSQNAYCEGEILSIHTETPK